MIIGDSIVKLAPNNRSDALAIHVHNGVAHTTGYQHSGESRRVMLWKGNEGFRLSDLGLANTGTAILVSDDQVLIGGNLDRNGRTAQYLWTDGEAQFKAGSLDYSSIKSIAVDNEKVYLAGQFAQGATQWDENSYYTLANPSSIAAHIAFRDGVPYVIGMELTGSSQSKVTVWKNRARVFENTLGMAASTLSATMHKSDYYYAVNSAGNQLKANIYKNDQLLYQLAEGQSVVTTAIRVFRDKVYVLGQIINGSTTTPTLWVDGKPQTLFDNAEKIYLNDFFIY